MRGPSPSCAVAGRRLVDLPAGTSRVRFFGRFHGRPLRPGTYGITLVARRGGARTRLGTLAVQIVAPGEPIRHSRTRPEFACGAGASSGFLFASLGLAVPASVGHVVRAEADDPSAFRPPNVEGPAALPKLSGPLPPGLSGSSGGLSWGGLLVYAALALAAGSMLVLVVRFMRGTWNP